MIFFTGLANYFSENKKNVFLFLVLFHSILSVLFYYLSGLDYFSNFTTRGFWNFAADSETYHNEAIFSVFHLEESDWSGWWNKYPGHKNVRIISLIYWLTGYHQPIIYEIVNSILWASSIILIFNVSELLFPKNNKVALFAILFFFLPTVLLQSTQLLRDPIFTFGFSLLCYSFVSVYLLKSKWKWILVIQIALICLVTMRDYLSPVFLLGLIIFSIIVLIQKKLSIIHIFVLIAPILIYENISENKYLREPSQLSLAAQTILKNDDYNSLEKYQQEFEESYVKGKAKQKKEDIDVNNKLVKKEVDPIKYQRQQRALKKIEKYRLEKALERIDALKKSKMSSEDLKEIQNTKNIDDEIKLIVLQNANEIEDQLIKVEKNTEILNSLKVEKDESIIQSEALERNLAILENLLKDESFYKENESLSVKAENLTTVEKELVVNKNEKSLSQIESLAFIFAPLDSVARQISTLRYGFKNKNHSAGSKIDTNTYYSNFNDLFSYLPRAIQVGLFAPFPSNWIKEGSSVGLIGNILAGIEMLAWYVIISGFSYTLLSKPTSIMPLLPIIIVSLMIILLMAYSIPNIGALFRMRQPYMIPFYIYGTYGLSQIITRINNKLTKNA